jgi:hypothetical protein
MIECVPKFKLSPWLELSWLTTLSQQNASDSPSYLNCATSFSETTDESNLASSIKQLDPPHYGVSLYPFFRPPKLEQLLQHGLSTLSIVLLGLASTDDELHVLHLTQVPEVGVGVGDRNLYALRVPYRIPFQCRADVRMLALFQLNLLTCFAVP